MAVTTVADLDSIIQTIVGEVRFTARHAVPMAGLVTRIDMPEHRGSPIDLPKLDTLTAFDLTEGVDWNSFESVGDTDVSIDPTEVGVFVALTDRMLRRSPQAFERTVASEAKRAYSYKLDLDLTRQVSSFSTQLIGTGNPVSIGGLTAARAQITGKTEPGEQDINVCLHPYHIKDLVDDLVAAASTDVGSGMSDEITRNYLTRNYIGRTKLYGMGVYEDGNFEVDGTPNAHGVVMSRNAIFLAITLEPTEENDRDISLRGEELVIVGEYGYAEWLDNAGVDIFGNATAPTG
jgi:hypothetical protein